MNAYDTLTLLGVIREMDRFSPFMLNLLFPDVATFETSEISFDQLGIDMNLAPFVSPLKEGKIVSEQRAQLKKFAPPYIKPKNALTPDRLIVRKAGEGIGGQLSPAERRDAIIVDILMEHQKKILRRMEWMASQIVLSGKVTVEGEDYPTSEVDFERDADKTFALTGANRWSESTSTPNDDLEDWFTRLEAPCTHIVFGRKAYQAFVKHDDIKGLVDSRRGSDTKLEMAPATTLSSFRGRLGDAGPELWVYSGWYKDDAGDKQFFIPDNVVLLVSTAVEGVRAFGAILDKGAGYQALESFPKMWEIEDPSVEMLMTQSSPLPVPRRINATLAATVID